MSDQQVTYEKVPYAAVEGWAQDDHAAAFAAFLRSAPVVLERVAKGVSPGASRPPPSPELIEACLRALAIGESATSDAQAARAFFEDSFTPHRLIHSGPQGLVTGYYEPSIVGSRQRTDRYAVPVHARPSDLVNLIDEADRGARAGQPTHARRAADGELVAHFTRREIDAGALAGQGLELLYVADPIDLFFMQVQGSGLIEFEDGSAVRLTYDGKNGFNYTSIGRYLIDTGQFPSEAMTLQALIDWLKADSDRAREVMWQNESYVFFRELGPASETSACGVDGIPLSAGRTLAVDTAFREIGAPVYVTAPSLTRAGPGPSHHGFRRLMIAQDVGSAIKGPERGDIYFGSGPEAGSRAGETMNAARFIDLRPNAANRGP